MTRIDLFTDSPRLGGAERALEEVARAAVAAEHDVTLLGPQRWLLEHFEQGVPGLKVAHAAGDAFRGKARRAARTAGALAQLPALAAVAARRPDVLHVSNGGYPGSPLCRLLMPLARLGGAGRRLMTVNAMPRPREESVASVERLLDPAVWASTDAVIGPARMIGPRLGELRGMPPERYVHIPYGVHVPSGAEEAARLRAQLGAGERELVVAMVSATSDEQKGHVVLVEALARASGVRAVIVGDPPPPAAQRRIAELELADRVVLTGRMDDVGPVLHAMDVLVLPSVADEGFPLVMLEAMAAGKPVIASRIAGVPEAVEDGATGRLFEPGDSEALAALLREADGRRELLGAWGAEGRARWEARYSVAAMVAANLALYSGALPGRSTGEG